MDDGVRRFDYDARDLHRCSPLRHGRDIAPARTMRWPAAGSSCSLYKSLIVKPLFASQATRQLQMFDIVGEIFFQWSRVLRLLL
jgi:hypothetical protein